jgi:hypothetical protein
MCLVHQTGPVLHQTAFVREQAALKFLFIKNIGSPTVTNPVEHQIVFNDYLPRARASQRLADGAPEPEVHQTGLVLVKSLARS